MAGTSSKNVAVGKPTLAVSGGLLGAPTGTERPTTYAGPYDAADVSVSYLPTDGGIGTSERSSVEIRPRGGQKVRTPQTELVSNLALTLIESRNAEALKLVFGDDNVDTCTAGEIVIKRNEKVLPHRQFIIDMLDGENSRHLDVGYGQVTEVGDISY